MISNFFSSLLVTQSTEFTEQMLHYHQVDGEIALLLWIMIYAARDSKKKISLKRLLSLTTENISGRDLKIGDEEIELSCGLAGLIRVYVGEGSLQRKQKLFPHLTPDKVEDHFRRASEVILPPGSMPALPGAFLTFPHLEKTCRIDPRCRRQQLRRPLTILHNPISFQELKRQLIEKSKPIYP